MDVGRAEPQAFDRVLSSMVTRPHPVARDAAERFLADNPGDPGSYPTVAALEREAVDLLGEVTRLDDPTGYVAGGGTEANVQAVRMARERARERDVGDPNVVAPASAHFSFDKAAALLDVELRAVPTDDDHRADPDAMAGHVDDATALVVGVAGSTEHGRVDPIPALCDLAHDAGALCHVDAAWGGFALPFTDHAWDFADAPIDTMTIDPHKLGQAAVPAGGILVREETLLDALTVQTPYLQTASQVSLAGTRSGAGVASAAAALDALWPDGYRASYERTAADAAWLHRELEARGHDVVSPELPLVATAMDPSTVEALRDREWRISRTAGGTARVVLMPHVTRPMLERFLDDLDAVSPP
jgi:tyrosine decarboxylase/aspartate 1-decarboxylase